MMAKSGVITIDGSTTNLVDDNEPHNKILEVATAGLNHHFIKLLNDQSKQNAYTISEYVIAMNSEINPSTSHREGQLKILCYLSDFHNQRPFSKMTQNDVMQYLDSHRRSEESDPLHKWIGTYNLRRAYLLRFFKWLYYPELEPSKRPIPDVVKNIPSFKRKEQSIYKPTDLWTEQDDALFLKYCPNKRDRCYHMVAHDSSCRPSEILGLKIKSIVFKTTDEHQYAEILVSGKTGTRHIPLFSALPYIKDWLDSHPQRGNPNAYLIPSMDRKHRRFGNKMKSTSLNIIYRKYKLEFFPVLLEDPKVAHEDKQKIKDLLQKPWNPYIRRHSALTQKSTMLKEHVLRQHAGWSGRSQMHLKYLHYFGNESSESLLEAYGIVSKDQQSVDVLRPKQCPNCNEPNKPDSKFCAKCRMVLTYDAYNETLEGQKQKEDQLNVVQSQVDKMQSQIQSLMSAFSNMQEQPQVDSMAKTLYSSGLLIKAAADNNNTKEQQQLIKAAGKAAYHATRTKSALTRESKAKAKSSAK
jgi:integrase/recombinase XerD